MINIVYKIKNNEDWNNLQENEHTVDISNDAYFGYRAMEKFAKNIMYDPCYIDSLVRVVKEGKKFPNTIHILQFSDDSLGYETIGNTENFIKAASRKIEEIININSDIKLKIHVDRDDKEKIISVLKEIYKNTII